MKTCHTCQQTYSDDVESCPRDGARLAAESREERECPYCAERILKKARVCKHCGHDVGPVAGTDIAAQTPHAVPPERIVETPGDWPEQPLRRSGKATASLILGIFAFLPSAFLAVEGAGEFERGRITADFVGSICLAGVAGLLTVIYGHRTRASIRRSGGRLLGKGTASGGLVLGYMGLTVGFVALVLVISLRAWIVPARILAFNRAVAVGSLQVLNGAATAYASMYDRGFPLTLAVLGPPQKRVNPTDSAAGLLSGAEASGTYGGYRFTYIAGPVDSAGRINTYTLRAEPVEPA
jgi:DNA-directed RNA polymerase subunit RPC12/RpoP